MVFIAVASVILYRITISIDYCSDLGSIGCLIAGTVASSVINAVLILVLGKIYDILAVKLTDWGSFESCLYSQPLSIVQQRTTGRKPSMTML
jgi:hypothetical protein